MSLVKSPRILAVASAGGHWVQLMRLCPSWDGCEIAYVTTSESRGHELIEEAKTKGLPLPKFYVVTEASRWEKIRLIRQLLQIIMVLIQERPDIIISTGAAPGFFALSFGKLLGARTIWVDSIANSEELSLSGRKVGGFADLWLTQWEHLAGPNNSPTEPRYAGKVI